MSQLFCTRAAQLARGTPLAALRQHVICSSSQRDTRAASTASSPPSSPEAPQAGQPLVT